ncbi:uncharacterized protein LOC17875734 [Capsella rubella]|uniref:uncharacterized protein LOC17875734 n=1 Tax=Capsella rubella TaxID=81985 RepID=UPI000CD50D34|nr:uncharacterized protein LOC17875734 [Capsella rubella]
MKHFDLCGNLSQIFIPQDLKTRTLKTPLFIDFCGEGQRDNALKLNGSDLEGWTLVVKPSPHQEDRHRLSYLSRKGERDLYVKVYDVPSSVRDIDLTIGLCDHFSSCGEVTCIDLLGHGPFEHERLNLVTILGEGCVEKAMERSGRNAQGWNIVIASVFGLPSRRNKVKLTGCEHPDILSAEMEKKEKAKMEKREKAKMEKAKIKKMENPKKKKKTTK